MLLVMTKLIIGHDTSPTSTLITLGAGTDTNGNNENIIAYCFHSVTGYSKIGTYTGNATSGLTITTGFRPAFLLVKEFGQGGENWYVFDSNREPLGELQTAIKLDSDAAEVSSSAKKVEFTSTGFKLKLNQFRFKSQQR